MADIHPDDAGLVEHIVNVCEEMRKHGYTIRCGGFGLEIGPDKRWYSPDKCLCPLAAMVLDTQGDTPMYRPVTEAAGIALNRSPLWSEGFWRGFDKHTVRYDNPEWMRGFHAGAEVHRRLLG